MMNKQKMCLALGAVMLAFTAIMFVQEHCANTERDQVSEPSQRISEVNNDQNQAERTRKISERSPVEISGTPLGVLSVEDMIEEDDELRKKVERGEKIQLEFAKNGSILCSQIPFVINDSLEPSYFQKIEERFRPAYLKEEKTKIPSWIHGRGFLLMSRDMNHRYVLSPEDIPHFGAETPDYFVYCAKRFKDMEVGQVVSKKDGRIRYFDLTKKQAGF